MYSLEELNFAVSTCTKCRLSETRMNTVFGQGSSEADIMFIGEGPGYNEDQMGEAFIGPAGQLFTKGLNAIGMERNQVYIANIVKCRPPNNRDPRPDEMNMCMNYLRWQFKIINPKVIVCLGRIASINIIDKDIKVSKERGIWINKNNIWIMPTFHPSAVLRDEKKRKPFWEDLKSIKEKCKELDIV